MSNWLVHCASMPVCLLYQRQNRDRFGLGFFSIFFLFIHLFNFLLHQLNDNFYARCSIARECAFLNRECDLILIRRTAFWHRCYGRHRYRCFILITFILICITFHTIDFEQPLHKFSSHFFVSLFFSLSHHRLNVLRTCPTPLSLCLYVCNFM